MMVTIITDLDFKTLDKDTLLIFRSTKLHLITNMKIGNNLPMIK
jgi:hypothetical protein